MSDIPLRIRNKEGIFGIRLNNSSFKLDPLNFEDDQSMYEVICNVDLSNYHKGNGSFSVSFTSKNGLQGMLINNWTLLEGYIRFDWGESESYFWLLDQKGVKTTRIKAGSSHGSHSGFNVESLTKSILLESRNIILRFPSASIYNAFSDFMDTQTLSPEDARQFLEGYSNIDIINTFQNHTLRFYTDFLHRYNDLMKLLSNCEDERCKHLANIATVKCSNAIKLLQ